MKKMFNKKNTNQEIWKWGIGAGATQVLYVLLVILFFNLMEMTDKEPNEFLTTGFFMLLFFVMSVLISGAIVFGRPVILALDSKIKQAVFTFFVTLTTIFVIFLVVLFVVLV